MKRVLITGGAGFIGVHLADHLTQSGGYDVTVLDNESLGDRANIDNDQVRSSPATCAVASDLRARSRVRTRLSTWPPTPG